MPLRKTPLTMQSVSAPIISLESKLTNEDILLWSQIEVNLAIISASAPALRPLFKKTFAGSSDRSKYGAGFGYGQRSQLGDTRGAVELRSYNGKSETMVKTAMDDNSSQEHILEDDDQRGLRKTVETSVFREN